jgi:hypothetical protein
MLRNMKVVLGGLLLLLCLGCGGDEPDAERFAIYHLETSIGRPGEDGELRCGPPRLVCPGVVPQPPPGTFKYRVRAAPALAGSDVVRSSARRATAPGTGVPLVILDFTAEGRAAFARLTREAAHVGGRDQTWHHIAVVVGDEIVAFPQIDFDDHPDGIPDAPAIQIAAVDDADARDLVERLRGE